MKKFVVCIEGAGEGCDYTIGCNKRFYETEAESIDDLLLEFHEEHDGENYLKRRNDFAYENVYVIEGGLINVTDKLQAMIDKELAARPPFAWAIAEAFRCEKDIEIRVGSLTTVVTAADVRLALATGGSDG